MIDNEENLIKEKYFKVITLAVTEAKAYTDEKLKSISWLMVGVVIVCFLAFIQLVVDSFHVNNATYREYSQKTETTEITQNTNKVLLKKIQDLAEQNNKNQEIIIELQKQLLNKK